MHNQTTTLARNRLATALLGLGLFLAVFSTGRANSYYHYSIDTSAYSLSGPGFLAFDLLDGDNVANNTVTVTGLSTDGSMSDMSDFSLTDAGFFILNEVLRDIVFGTTLSFDLELTSNFAGITPDSFGFYLLDDTASMTLFPTSDPRATDALFAVDIDGSASGNSGVYAGSLTVPEQGSSLALGGLAFGLLAFARRFVARRAVA